MENDHAISAFLSMSSPQEDVTERPPQEVIAEYIEWRAYMQNVEQSARLCSIKLEDALWIERLEDFSEQVEKIRQYVKDNPEAAIQELMPRSIGVLRAELANGNIAAAREVSRLASQLKPVDKPKTGRAARIAGELDGNDSGASRTSSQRRDIAKTALGISQGRSNT